MITGIYRAALKRMMIMMVIMMTIIIQFVTVG